MDFPALIGELTADEPARRMAAADALVKVGAPAVEPLIAECQRRSRTLPDRATNRAFYEGNAHVDVLRRIGDAAFRPLLRAIASAQAESDVLLIRRAFEGLAVSDPGMFGQTLGHPHPWLRGSSLRAIAGMGSGALRYAPRVVPLLSDPVGFVQDDALGALRAMGEGVMAVLHRTRQAGPHRRQALTGLAGVGGWDAPDASDQQLVRRLIRIRIRQESPEPMDVCGSWIAVPTADQAAVLEAFGLCEAEPVTMRLGAAAHSNSLTYVTPALNGWTLVFGGPHNATFWEDLVEPMKAWSRRFGAAHSYLMFEGCTGWCIFENGEIVRYYNSEAPDKQIGPPHPAESGLRLTHEESDPERDEALQFDARMQKFVKMHFAGPHPADMTPESALPSILLWDWIDEFMRFFELEGTGPDWYPDETFADLDLFRRATVALATAARGPGTLERYWQEEAMPVAYAPTVAEHASVNPRTLGVHIRVEGHAVLARSAGEGGGSPFSGVREMLPI